MILSQQSLIESIERAMEKHRAVYFVFWTKVAGYMCAGYLCVVD